MKRETFTTSAPEGQLDVDRFPTDAAVESSSRMLYAAQLIWMDRRRVWRATVAGIVIALIIALISPNIYESTTRLMPPDNNQGGLGLASLASLVRGIGGGSGSGGGAMPGMVGDFLGIKSSGALFVGVLGSRTVQEALVNQAHLQQVYGWPLLRLSTTTEKARKKLASNTEVTEDRKSGIITVSVHDTSRERAALLAKGYVDQLNRLMATVSTSSAKREREFLEGRLKEVKQDLDAAVKNYSEFSSKNSTLDLKDQGKAMVEAAAMLQGQLIAAESELKGVEAIYTDNNVRVRTVRARIAEIKKQMATMSGSSSPVVPNSALNGKDTDTLPYPSLRQLPIVGATWADLYRRVRVQEVVFEILTQQYEMAKVQEAKDTPTIKVLDQANVPEYKYGPHRSLYLLCGAFAGMFIGMGMVLISAKWRGMDPQDPFKVLVEDVRHAITSHRWWQRGEVKFRMMAMNSRQRFRRKSSEPDA